MKNDKRVTWATTAVFAFALIGAVGTFAAHTGAYSCAYADNVKFPLTLAYPAGGKPQVLRLDFGAPSTGGYAVFDVASAKGSPVLRVAYANHPDGLGEKGCFSRETSARYLGPTFDIPALPGNINRHELYRICRTGRFVAPLIQGQERYARIQLDTPGEVTLSSFKIENAEVFRDGEFQGSFSCSDSRLNELWKISAWTCQIAAFPNHDAWKRAGGRLLPRKLEAASGEGFCALPAPFDGTLTVEYEFDANPHFPQGRFEVIAGGRRTEVVQTSTNEMNTVSVPVARGERFGIAVEKESWPVIASISISPKKGDRFWDARLDDPKSLLNWDFARTLPYVADGAKRDRLIWSGDLWWAERNIFYSFNPGNEPYMRGSVMLLGFNQTPEGYVQACPYAERYTPPAKGEWGPFPSDEFAAWFVPVLYDYYLYSGDAKTARELYPNVLKLMDYLAAHTENDGTFVQRAETSKHACNLNLGDTSHRAYMDILLWKCCIDAAAMAADFGDMERQSRFVKWGERLSTAIRTRFWDSEEGFFMLSDKNHGFGFEANALALATRFATQEEALRIAPHLKHTGHGKFQALAVRGLMEYGFMERGLKAIEVHNWYKLLDTKWKGALTTTECMGLHRRGWGDESHPDTAIAGILSAEVLGVKPTAPGYTRFEMRPRPCRGMTFAKGKISTPQGFVNAAWKLENGSLVATLDVPKGTVAKVVLPPCKGITVNGREATDLGALPAGDYMIVAKNVKPEALADPVKDAVYINAKGNMRFSASSSHEARPAWSLRNLAAQIQKDGSKGWSSKAHDSAKAEEWLIIELGAVKSVEKLELWARDDGDSRNGTAGFPRAFVVEGMDGSGAWRVLKTYADVTPPKPGKSFVVDFYTVIGHPKVKALRVRATELGTPAADEPSAWRLQFKRIAVTTSGF